MIDAAFQGRGIGRSALLLVIKHVRAKGVCSRLELSYVPGPRSPENFYRGLGFKPNGKVDEGEVVMELLLGPDGAQQQAPTQELRAAMGDAPLGR
jgi:diamine N-acetyltransferase